MFGRIPLDSEIVRAYRQGLLRARDELNEEAALEALSQGGGIAEALDAAMGMQEEGERDE